MCHGQALTPSPLVTEPVTPTSHLPIRRCSAVPPALVLRRKLDNVVPLSRENALIKVLDQVGAKYEEHIYPRGDHAFNGVVFDDIVQTTDKFLLKY